MDNEVSRVVRVPGEGHFNFLNEGCEYLDLELCEAYTRDDLARNSESTTIRVDPIGSK